jgi:serine/threonine-protein kinase
MKITPSLAGLLLALSLVGCNSNGQTAKMHMTETESLQAEGIHGDIKDAAKPNLTAQTHFATGQMAEASGALADAIKQYNEALTLDPKNPNYIFRLGVVYTESKQFDLAIDTWKQYVNVTDRSATAYGNLGFCYEVSNQPIEAERTYKAGIERDSHNMLCRVNYGLMLARQKRIPEAMKTWEPVLKPAEMHYNLASIYELSGRKREARIEFQKAIDLDPKLYDAQSRMAKLDLK